MGTRQVLAGQTDTLAAESDIPHRQANALYCRGLLDCAPRRLAAAERHEDAGQPLQKAKALEAAAGHFIDADDCGQARATLTRAVEIYDGLGAAADVAWLQAIFRVYSILRGPRQAPAATNG